jgi:hypothetical protein
MPIVIVAALRILRKSASGIIKIGMRMPGEETRLANPPKKSAAANSG